MTSEEILRELMTCFYVDCNGDMFWVKGIKSMKCLLGTDFEKKLSKYLDSKAKKRYDDKN